MNRLLRSLCFIALSAACSSEPDAPRAHSLVRAAGLNGPEAGRSDLSPRLMRRFKPLAAATAPADSAEAAKVALGRMLYFEPRLSRSGTISCNSCHPLDQYGATHDQRSLGVGGQRGTRNAPSTYNAARHFAQFWDGRSADVETQAGGPMLNAAEMGMSDTHGVESALKAVPGYAPWFTAAFPGAADPIVFENICAAIGDFERGLITPSRWDRYLRGDEKALSDQERQGAHLFANLGCLVCHAGELVGGTMFEKVGARVPWPNQADKGRAAVTHAAADEMMFKVPSLRNVARTAPYFHDGSAATLEQAVRLMARHQLDEELSDDEVSAVAAWLGSLTGELPSQYIQKPALPSSP